MSTLKMCETANIHSSGNWRHNIYSQLVHRNNISCGTVSGLIKQLNVLEERCEKYRVENISLTVRHELSSTGGLSSPAAGATGDNAQAAVIQALEQKVYKLQEELTSLHRGKGDTAEQLLAVTNCLQEREKELQQRNNRVAELESEVLLHKEECARLKGETEQLTNLNTLLHDEYTTLNMTYDVLHKDFMKLKDENTQLVQRWIEYKSKDAERLNEENDKHFKSKQRAVEASIREAAEEFKAVFLPEEVPGEGSLADFAYGSMACPVSVLPTACYFKMETHDAELHTFRLSHKGKLLATGGEDRKLKLWNVLRDGLSPSHTLMGSNSGINDIAFSADDSLVMAASSDYAARIWTVNDSRIRHTLTGHSGKVSCCEFVSDQSQVITGANDRTIKIWDLKSKACSRTLFVGSSCTDLSLPRSCPSLLFSGHLDRKLRMYDLRTQATQPAAEVLLSDKITSVMLFNSGNYCLASCRDNVLRVVDVRQKEVVTELCAVGLQLGSDVARACVSPDDMYVAMGSNDGSIYLWNAASGALATTLTDGHTSCVLACCWSPDGQSFLSCERSKQVMMWSHL